MSVQQMTSEEIEDRMLAIFFLAPYMPPQQTDQTFAWLGEAVKELRLRRLARSAG